MSAHTPGPWEVQMDGHRPHVMESMHLTTVAIVSCDGPEVSESAHAEALADARLIAAAPRMADALMKALAAGHDGDEPDWDDIEAALREAGVMP